MAEAYATRPPTRRNFVLHLFCEITPALNALGVGEQTEVEQVPRGLATDAGNRERLGNRAGLPADEGRRAHRKRTPKPIPKL